MRKLAREAVIFILLGPVAAIVPAFIYFQRQSLGDIKYVAARKIYAAELDKPRPDFIPIYSVAVPLTTGETLFVTDCGQLYPSAATNGAVSDKPSNTMPRTEQFVPGSTNGKDCVYFDDEVYRRGGHLSSVTLGNKNQIAVEKAYWAAFAKAKAKHHQAYASAVMAGFLSLWGIPAGFAVWICYRLIRFAAEG